MQAASLVRTTTGHTTWPQAPRASCHTDPHCISFDALPSKTMQGCLLQQERLTHLQHSVEGRLQRAGPVRWKEAEQDALRRHVIERHILRPVERTTLTWWQMALNSDGAYMRLWQKQESSDDVVNSRQIRSDTLGPMFKTNTATPCEPMTPGYFGQFLMIMSSVELLTACRLAGHLVGWHGLPVQLHQRSQRGPGRVCI